MNEMEEELDRGWTIRQQEQRMRLAGYYTTISQPISTMNA